MAVSSNDLELSFGQWVLLAVSRLCAFSKNARGNFGDFLAQVIIITIEAFESELIMPMIEQFLIGTKSVVPTKQTWPSQNSILLKWHGNRFFCVRRPK